MRFRRGRSEVSLVDEVARRRALKHRTVKVDRMPDGDLAVICDDLTVICGMTAEVLAEVRALAVATEDVCRAMIALDDAANLARTLAGRLLEGP